MAINNDTFSQLGNTMGTSNYTGHAVQIALIYFVFGLLWILLSDSILSYLVQDIDSIARIQMYKGGVFIVLTSALVFRLVKRQILRQQQRLVGACLIKRDA